MSPDRKRIVRKILIASILTYVWLAAAYFISTSIGLSSSGSIYVCIACIGVPTDVMLWTISLPLPEWWIQANRQSEIGTNTLMEIRDSFKKIETNIRVMSLNMQDVRNAIVEEGALKKREVKNG